MPINEVSNYEGIPAMTSPQVHEYLEFIGETCWHGGAAMELGSWLGGSSAPLMKGLKKAGYNKPFYAFEKWIAAREQPPKAASQGVKIIEGQDLLPLYLTNVAKYYDNVSAYKGGLPGMLTRYDGGPIDICIFDAPKQEPVFSGCMAMVEQYFTPGKTVLGLLDYNFYLRHAGVKRKKFRAPVDFIEKHTDCFEEMKRWDDEAVVFFRYIKKVEWTK
jgi:hypothetical protein